jgi:hypothetical protein
MKKYLVALMLGLTIGYFYGFADAKANAKNVVSRAVERVGGKGQQYHTDIDAKLEAVERR